MDTTVHIRLFLNLKQKAGIGRLELKVSQFTTIAEIKTILEEKYPGLRTQLDNIMMLMGKKIVLDEDVVEDGAEISFLTPVGGG